MRTLIIYTSQTGFTKKYADWIAEKAKADILDLKNAQKKNDGFLEEYDSVIYASWCMAGKVVKADWFLNKTKNLKDKKLAVVAVGASPNDNPDVDVAMNNLLSEEQKQYIKVFYCQGGLDYDKMKFFSRFALKMFVKALKKSKDEKQRGMGAYIDHSYDATDIKYIDPILDFLGTEK